MPANAKRILTTHVGSLARPQAFIDLMKRKERGEAVSDREYTDTLENAVAEIVRLQAEAGIDIVSDGELGKPITWSRYILFRMAGFERRPVEESGMPMSVTGKDRRDFAEFYKEYDASVPTAGMRGWTVTGPISYKPAAIREDVRMFKAALARVKTGGAFMCAVSPASVAPDRKDEFYANKDDALQAIADALRGEYRAIADAGITLQVDDSYFPSMYDVIVPPGTLRDYRRWAAQQVEVINYALKGIPEEKVRFHICWGSWNGPHSNDVPAKHVVDLMLRIKAGAYLIEMANPRHEHEWQVWKDVKLPPGRILVPGTITHATNIVEHPELVAERIVRLAKLVGRDNIMAGTDCGFAQQGPFLSRVHPSIQWAKLRSLVEGARLATKQLWPRAAKAGIRKPVRKPASKSSARSKRRAA
ncbi:MAG: epoxyalkane--coenzyme M transferase [Betaproteobacteria bacterium]|nr:epoxyalkane--coenzyme M transferase [Betaproteobacteria bacterium]